jgi:hypothetical protein
MSKRYLIECVKAALVVGGITAAIGVLFKLFLLLEATQ